MTTKELIENFIRDASKDLECKIVKSNISRQVFETSGNINYLFYIKTRTTNSNWGVTKNVIDKLKKEKGTWFVLLLSTSPFQNYILASDSVEFYIKNRWNLNQDGDYKTSSSFPDENIFNSFSKLKINI